MLRLLQGNLAGRFLFGHNKDVSRMCFLAVGVPSISTLATPLK